MRRRRDILAGIGGASLVWLSGGSLAHTDPRRVVVLYANSESPIFRAVFHDPITRDLASLGWRDGQNLRLAYHFAEGDEKRFESLAAEIVKAAPDVIIAMSPLAVLVLRQHTSTIPIVFYAVGDPVGYGLVDSMAKPGGNITGVANFGFPMGGKWLDLLKQLAPSVNRVAFIYHPGTTTKGYELYLKSVTAAAQGSKIAVNETPVADDAALDRALMSAAGTSNGGLIIPPDPFTFDRHLRIIEAAARLGLPAVYPFDMFVKDGGLASYSVDNDEQVAVVAAAVDRILKSVNPGEIPVQGPSKFQLAINANAAAALGLTIPPSLLATADEVIE